MQMQFSLNSREHYNKLNEHIMTYQFNISLS